jgi:predicted dehydrogenase
MGVSRRQFLGKSTAVVVAGMAAAGRVFGANERIRAGCIGLNGRGAGHVQFLSDNSNSEVVALCDVDSNVLAQYAKVLEDKTKAKPFTTADMRELFGRADIDVISIATPNHWHTLAAMWAMEAGKDVYVEKPCSHTVWEGRQLVAAAEKHGRICQHGTQSRSEPGRIRSIQRLREGAIGEVYMARALCYKVRDSIGVKPDSAPPANVNWELWQGPASDRPYNANYVHYNWHWFWHYGNGDIGNQGVHEMDIAVWGMNKGLPVRVQSSGGRYGYKDQGETANTQISTFHYADGTMLVFEVRGRYTNDEATSRVGNMFYGSEGYLTKYAEPGTKVIKFPCFDKNNKEIPDASPVDSDPNDSTRHFDNFLTAVRSRKQEDIHGTAQQGHISSAHCHLANIAYRLGRVLHFDPTKERFINDAEADALLTREYRPGFEVPKLA